MSDFRAQIEANLFGTIIVTKAALPYFRERKGGHFVQFSLSVAGTRRHQSVSTGMYFDVAVGDVEIAGCVCAGAND
jgi:NAD(P)-dependent dehydrogenase (short-subunit alcohol dehydrogenase family)